MKKIFNVKKLLVAALSLCMVLGVNVTNAKADTIVTDTKSTSSSYYLYVWEGGSSNMLGRMHLECKTASVQNTFTAYKDCKATTVYVSQSSASGSFVSNGVSSLPKNASVLKEKHTASPSKAYGYCSVGY